MDYSLSSVKRALKPVAKAAGFRRGPGRPGSEAHGRSFVKAISWRATGSLDTFVISWLVTGKTVIAGSITGSGLLTKILLYYLHERIWASLPWGRRQNCNAHSDSVFKPIAEKR